MGEKKERIYYKKWWFWLIGIILIIASTISPPKSTVSSITATAGIITAPATLVSGTYKIGTDIKAGEYVLIAEEGADVQTFEFSGLFNSYILDVSGIKRIIVTLIDGQYLKLEAKSCKIYPVNSAPKLEMNGGKLYAGAYKVGVDFQAGKYKIFDYTYAQFNVYKESTFIANKIQSVNNFSGVKEVTLSDGQIILVKNRYIILNPVSVTTSSEVSTGTSYKAGIYKVGTDIKAGEYVLVADGGIKGSFDVRDYRTKGIYICSGSFENRVILTVKSGETLKVEDCTIYTFDSAPKTVQVDGRLPAGMYKAGIDIPAGNYNLAVCNGTISYYELATDSRHLYYGATRYNKTETISVKNGEYLTVENGYIIVK